MLKQLFKTIFNGKFDWIDGATLFLLLGIIGFATKGTWAPLLKAPRLIPDSQSQTLPPPPKPDETAMPQIVGGGDAAPVPIDQVTTDDEGLPPIPQVTLDEFASPAAPVPRDSAPDPEPLKVTADTVIALQQQINSLQKQLDAQKQMAPAQSLRMENIVAAVLQELPAGQASGSAAPFKMTAAIKKEIEDNVAWYYKNRPLPQAVKVEIEHKAAWYAEREVTDQLEARFKALFDKYFSRISEPMPKQ